MTSPCPEERVTVAMLHQRWRDVVFAHWPVPPGTIDELLPPGLRADTREGHAWLTLTPFSVEHSRPPLVPSLPIVSNFIESNVRTYVVGPDGRDGLWFFTLETNSLSTTVGANVALNLPYRWASANLGRAARRITYRTRRRLCEPPPEQTLSIECLGVGRLRERGLADWLTGRWRAWTVVGRRLGVVPVEHGPWPLAEADLIEQSGTLITSLDLPAIPDRPVVHWSPGVDAKLGWPRFVHR